ncbi:MAG: hypothetical protein JWQ55_4357 [Rhodopila sp.]|jgi:hypothetical protein|nr:hypothetical protein [Rhodopila sp.]
MSLDALSGLSGSSVDWASTATQGSSAAQGSSATRGSTATQSPPEPQSLEPIKLPQPVMKIPTTPLSPAVLAELIGRQLPL